MQSYFTLVPEGRMQYKGFNITGQGKEDKCASETRSSLALPSLGVFVTIELFWCHPEDNPSPPGCRN